MPIARGVSSRLRQWSPLEREVVAALLVPLEVQRHEDETGVLERGGDLPAALDDQAYLQATRCRILVTRARMMQTLPSLGFHVCPSQANFIWCRRDDRPVKPLYEALKSRGILVRYMVYDGYGDGLRISVGSDAEIDRLFDELKRLV